MVALVLLCGMHAAAHAQVAAYGMGSAGFLSSVNSSNAQALVSPSFSAYGGTFGVYDDFIHLGPVALGTDGRLFLQSNSNGNQYGNQLRGGLAGVRVALFSHFVPFSPYLQGEIGAASTNYGIQPQRSTSFTYQISGGLDYTIIPHLDARLEYGAGQIGAVFPGTRQEMQQLGIGLVVRFF
jgi:opacity protein-like surface antigen